MPLIKNPIKSYNNMKNSLKQLAINGGIQPVITNCMVQNNYSGL
jgi:hypothetical protein